MKKFIARLCNGIAKLLGLPTQEQITDLTNKLNEAIKERNILSYRFDTMNKEIYRDIDRINNKINNIKPVLKVKDKESVNFIKGILSKHDNKINTQQQFLEHKKIELENIEVSARNAVDKATKASGKLNNVLNALGLTNTNDPDFSSFRELIIEKTRERAE